jgi:hypothetical protein
VIIERHARENQLEGDLQLPGNVLLHYHGWDSPNSALTSDHLDQMRVIIDKFLT